VSTLVHIGVRAADLAQSLRFWRDGLGLQVVRQQPDRWDLTDGYHNFAILQYLGAGRPPDVSGLDDYLHVGVGVTDVAAAARRLRTMGFETFSDGLNGKQPLNPDQLIEPSFKVEDPDGIVVDVTDAASTWPGVSIAYTPS